MVVRVHSFWEGPFSGAKLVLGRVSRLYSRKEGCCNCCFPFPWQIFFLIWVTSKRLKESLAINLNMPQVVKTPWQIRIWQRINCSNPHWKSSTKFPSFGPTKKRTWKKNNEGFLSHTNESYNFPWLCVPFFLQGFFETSRHVTSSPRESQKHQTPALPHVVAPGFLTFCRSEPEADMSCSICLEGFCADPEQTTCFFLGKQGCFLGKPKKVTSWISVAWVRFNLWMAYLYHRLILRCEIQSLNSDVQSNHGFGISYILWSTYIYLADSMAIQGRCIPTKSDLYLVHVWNFQVYKVGSYRGL